MKKSHRNILLIIFTFVMLVILAFEVMWAYRQGRQDALREKNGQTNQSAK